MIEQMLPGLRARKEAEEAVPIFCSASVNACDSRGGSPEFCLGDSDEDDI